MNRHRKTMALLASLAACSSFAQTNYIEGIAGGGLLKNADGKEVSFNLRVGRFETPRGERVMGEFDATIRGNRLPMTRIVMTNPERLEVEEHSGGTAGRAVLVQGFGRGLRGIRGLAHVAAAEQAEVMPGETPKEHLGFRFWVPNTAVEVEYRGELVRGKLVFDPAGDEGSNP